jgi:hypothetical protein
VSVVIDSVQPAPVRVRQWTDVDYFGSFLAALALWKYVKGYDPLHPPLSSETERPELN